MIIASDRVIQLHNGTLRELNKQQIVAAHRRSQLTTIQSFDAQSASPTG
jgi:hypothetical protein